MELAADFWRAQNGVRHITPAGKLWPEGEWIKTAFDHLRDQYVVEFGCGPGRLARFFRPHQYLGVDINPRSIELAKEGNPAHTFALIDDKETLGPADVILCHTVLVHVPDDDLSRVLSRFDARRVLVNEMPGRRWRGDTLPPVFNREVSEYRDAFGQAGFALSDVTYEIYDHYQAPMALMEFTRL